MSELRKCPFCGKKARSVEGITIHFSDKKEAERLYYCPGHVVAMTADEWNRREPDWQAKWEGLVETVAARAALAKLGGK